MKCQQLAPKKLLKKSKKILIVTQLAIGDFTYMKTYLKALAEQYPHLKIHLWVYERRNKRKFLWWKNLDNRALYDWVLSCTFFDKVYVGTYSTSGFFSARKQALSENYSIAVSFAFIRPFRVAELTRSLAPNAFIVGIRHPVKFICWMKRLKYKKLNACCYVDPSKDFVGRHINDLLADWYEKLLGVTIIPKDRAPVIAIPDKWRSYALQKISSYRLNNALCKEGNNSKLIFINSFAKDKKRCWTIDHILQTIKVLRAKFPKNNLSFIVNSLPVAFDEVKQKVAGVVKDNVVVFTAQEHFFQLPSIISCCDLVISVETSIIHVAAALGVPVLALMRQKNPEWAPWGDRDVYVVTAQRRYEWVKDISPEYVMSAVLESKII